HASEELLEQELKLIGRVGDYPGQRCADFGIPPLDYQKAFAQARDRLRLEVRLDLEQRHLEQARAAYRGEWRVQVPALLGPCSPGRRPWNGYGGPRAPHMVWPAATPRAGWRGSSSRRWSPGPCLPRPAGRCSTPTRTPATCSSPHRGAWPCWTGAWPALWGIGSASPWPRPAWAR